MAMTADELQVLITANADDFNNKIKNVQSELSTLTKSAGSSSKGITAGIVAAGSLMSAAISKVFSVISSSADEAATRLDTLNNFPKVMSNLGIGTSDAQKSISTLSDKLIGLPTTLDTAATAVQRLTAANGNIAASTDMFLALNNAILAGGAPTELQTTAIEQLSQAYTKGKADATEWRAMLTAMPAQMNQVAQSMGYASAAVGGDLYNALQNGEVSMNDFMQAIMSLNKEGLPGFQSFEEQARNSTGGVVTSITNMKTALVRGIANIMDEIGQSNIASFFNAISSAIGTVCNYVRAFVRLAKQAVAWVQALFGGGSGSTEGLVQETSTASDNMSNVASGASDASDNLGSANKQAKKLKGTLASFDEMNVLSDNTSSDSSSGSSDSGTSGASGGFSDYTWNTDGLDSGADKVQEIVEKMQKAFESLGAWLSGTFSKTITRLGNLFANLGKIGSNSASFISNSWAKYGNLIAKSAGTAFNGIATLFDSVMQTLLAGLDGFVGGFSLRWETVGQTATDSVNLLLASLLETIGIVTEQLAAPFDALAEHLNAAGVNLGIMLAQVMTDFLASFAEEAPIIQENFVTFTDGITTTLTDFANLAGQVWADFTAILKSKWDEYGKDIADGVAQFVSNVIGSFQKIYDNIINPIISPFLEMLKQVWNEHLKAMVEEVAEFVAKVTQAALDIYNNFIAPVVNFITSILNPAFTIIGSVVSSVFGGVLTTISTVVQSVFGVFNGLIDFLTGIFSGNWEKAWNGVKDIFSNIVNGLGAIFKAPINFIIDIINGFIDGLNKIKIPDWVPGVGGKGINIGKIPKLATGGVVSRTTTAVIGEAGREAVLPLDRNTSWMDTLADKIGSKQVANVTLKMDSATVGNMVIDFINQQSAMKNRPVINV